jgi:hypothetical protein
MSFALFDEPLADETNDLASWYDEGFVLAFNPVEGATAFWLEGGFAPTVGWESCIAGGHTITNGTTAPRSNRRAPMFFPGASKISGVALNVLTFNAADDWAALTGAGDFHVVAVADLNRIAATVGILGDASIFADSGGNIGISVGESAGVYTASLFYASGTSGNAAVFDGWKYATVDITSLVVAHGRGRLVVQGKKEGGFVWIRVGSSAWVQGDACFDLWTSGAAAVPHVGADYTLATFLDGTVRALGFFNAAQADASWSDLIQDWADANFAPDNTRTLALNIGNYSANGYLGTRGIFTSYTSDVLGPGEGVDPDHNVETLVAPTTGESPANVSINSLNGPNGDGTDDYLDGFVQSGRFLKENGEEFTVGIAVELFSPDSVALGYGSIAQAPYSAPSLVGDAVGYWLLSWADDGGGNPCVNAGVFDGVARNNGGGANDGWQMVQLPITASTDKHYVQMRLRGHADDLLLDLRIDGGAWTSLPCGACQVLSGVVRLFANYALAIFADANVGKVDIDRVALTDSECDDRGLEAQTLTGWTLGFGSSAQDITGVGGVASGEAIGGLSKMNLNVSAPTSVASAESVSSATKLNLNVSNPTAVASLESVSSPQVNENIGPAGNIASLEVVSTTTKLNLNVSAPTSVASAEAVSTPTVNENVGPAGNVATAEVVPSPQINENVGPAGNVASLETVSSPALNLSVSSPTSVASAEAVSNPSVHLNVQSVGGVATAESVPGPTVSPGPVTVSPTGIASLEAIGAPSVHLALLTVGGLASAENVPNPTVSPGPVTITDAGGIASLEGVSGPFLHLNLVPVSIVSVEAVSSPSLRLNVGPAGNIATEESVSSPSLHLNLVPGSIPSAEAVSNPTVSPGPVTISPTGIASLEAVGSLTLHLNLLSSSVASEENVPSPQVLPQPVTISNAGGIASAEAIGVPTLNFVLLDGGAVASAESVSSPSLRLNVSAPTSIDSAEAVPSPGLTIGISSPPSVSSLEAVPSPAVTPGAVTVSNVGGVPSEEVVEDAIVFGGYAIIPFSIESEEAVGEPLIRVNVTDAGNVASSADVPAPDVGFTIHPTSIASLESVLSPAIHQTLQAVGGVASLETVPSPNFTVYILPTSIASDEAVSSPSLAGNVAGAGGVSSAENVPSPSLGTPAQDITNVGGIASTEAFGTPQIALTLLPASVSSQEAVGAPSVGVTISPASIGSGEVVSAPTLSLWLSAVGGVLSEEVVPLPLVWLSIQIITGAGGISSGEVVGVPLVALRILPPPAIIPVPGPVAVVRPAVFRPRAMPRGAPLHAKPSPSSPTRTAAPPPLPSGGPRGGSKKKTPRGR